MKNLEYKCPCCGGAITFDIGTQNLKCPYCDTEFEPQTLIDYDATLKEDTGDNAEWQETPGGQWQEGEKDGIRVYICSSCGGEVLCDENTAATSCPYCGNPQIIMSSLSGELKPDFVIPFKLDKKAAKEGLIKHLTKKKLLPKVFKDENHIDEVKGIYVPFWLYDADVNGRIRYRATRVRAWCDRRYNYVETSFFSALRGGKMAFENVPADGSKRIANDLMESIEPFDFSCAVDFQTAYLAGYFADKYDETSEESVVRANERIKNSMRMQIDSTMAGYNTFTPESISIDLKNAKAKYALYPVWLLNTTYKGKKYTFAMNGQTGKFVGNLPLDKGAYCKWLFSLTGIIGAAIFLLAYLVWLL